MDEEAENNAGLWQHREPVPAPWDRRLGEYVSKQITWKFNRHKEQELPTNVLLERLKRLRRGKLCAGRNR